MHNPIPLTAADLERLEADALAAMLPTISELHRIQRDELINRVLRAVPALLAMARKGLEAEPVIKAAERVVADYESNESMAGSTGQLEDALFDYYEALNPKDNGDAKAE